MLLCHAALAWRTVLEIVVIGVGAVVALLHPLAVIEVGSAQRGSVSALEARAGGIGAERQREQANQQESFHKVLRTVTTGTTVMSSFWSEVHAG